ncbi:Prepilin leader peptidase/N-methyltransferase (modular protein) [Rhodovastum atsumiense]|nr:A24 family peptidase [Rhodovastum atsumiense]CAH2601839.1 Prepilin leader peptidase/N-methyltransferase (modular protein) [Rhodovastum atsumiense]
MDGTGMLPPLLAAPVMGSWLGVLIRRLPHARPVALARSRCESCGTALGPLDLVPLLAWLWLRGRCRHCHAAIDPFHLWIELAATGVAAWAVLAAGDDMLRAWLGCGLGWTLLALAWIDLEWMVLPDVLTLPLLLGGIAASWLAAPDMVADAALGAVLGWAIFAGVAGGYRLLRGRAGLGGGDAKLLAAAGAWLGWPALPQVMLLAAVMALGVIGSLRLVQGQAGGSREAPLAFGPWLALAIWLTWLYGDVSP